MTEPRPEPRFEILPDSQAEAEAGLPVYMAMDGRSPGAPGGGPRDPLWVSALRGRLLAASASAVALYASGMALYHDVTAIAATGAGLDHVTELASHAADLADAGTAALVAGAALVSLVAALASKVREWARSALSDMQRTI